MIRNRAARVAVCASDPEPGERVRYARPLFALAPVALRSVGQCLIYKPFRAYTKLRVKADRFSPRLILAAIPQGVNCPKLQTVAVFESLILCAVA